jgi:Zn-dependent protease
LAGIATNLVLALLAAVVLKFTTQALDFPGNNLGVYFFVSLLQVNIVLAVFNAFPLPGFDGFNFFTTFRPISQLLSATPLGNPVFMAQYGLIVSLGLLFLVMPVISNLINGVLGFIVRIFGLY